MALVDDMVDLATSQIDEVSLHLANGDEVSGSGYTRLSPTFAAASDGETDLTATLEYNGPMGQEVHSIGLRDTNGDLLIPLVDLNTPRMFNSDNRLDVTSIAITQAVASAILE